MAEIIHPFYESHRGAMEAAMRHRLDLAEAMLCERALEVRRAMAYLDQMPCIAEADETYLQRPAEVAAQVEPQGHASGWPSHPPGHVGGA
jgi:hypothetical protein